MGMGFLTRTLLQFKSLYRGETSVLLISLSSFVKETMAGFYRACIVSFFKSSLSIVRENIAISVTKPCHMLL